LCTDRSSDSGIDQSQHGGTPKERSTGKFSRIGRSLVRLTGKGAEEGAAPRYVVESSGLGTSTVKMDKERWFSSHTLVTSRERPRSRGICAWGVGMW